MKGAVPALPGGLRRGLDEWLQAEAPIWAFVGKALLGACAALWLAYRLELPQPGTVLATVFIVMQPESGQVLAKSFYRIVGTLIGLAVTLPLLALFAQERVLFLLCLALWIGLCTAGAARYRDFRGYGCVLAGYTAALIGLPAIADPGGAFMQALWRVLEIGLGILCAGLVGALILPQNSSASLRRLLATRFRDFAAFAAAGLHGQLDTARLEQLNARFAGEAVALDNLRNASAFEDPHMRLRSGRLGRLNHEFMVLSTRFHGLHQLLQRLQGAAGAQVRAALAPCLAEVGMLLAPLGRQLGSEADAALLAARLEDSRRALMQQIRAARAGLLALQPGDAQLLDFNTAAEQLYRFAGDLHDYALTHASLLEHRHAREQWQGDFTPRANGLAAALGGLRSALLLLGLGAFWIASAWPSGETCVLTAAMVAGLVAGAPSPRHQALRLLVGALGSALLGCLLQFWVLPWLDGFALLYCALAPVFALGAWLLARSPTAGYGTGLMLWFCIIALPANLPPYDFQRLLNEYLAALLGFGLTALSLALILPPDRPWLWRRLERDLRMRVVFAVSGRLRGLAAGFESGTRDLLAQAQVSAAGRPEVQRQLLR